MTRTVSFLGGVSLAALAAGAAVEAGDARQGLIEAREMHGSSGGVQIPSWPFPAPIRLAVDAVGISPNPLITDRSAAKRAAEDERARICRPGFSQSLRMKGAEYYKLRDAAFQRAGVPKDQQCHKGEAGWECLILDHIVPLELDPPNPNSLDNVQIQTKEDAAAKDYIENGVTHLYCAGKITQEEAWSRFKRTSK